MANNTNTHRIFNGQDSVFVENCCDNKVVSRETFVAQAFQNMVDGSKRHKVELICATCHKVLWEQKERDISEVVKK